MYIVLFLVWLIFEGKIDVEVICFGLVLTTAIYAFMCKCMGYSIKKDLYYMRRAPWCLKYIFILLWEIIKANICVVKYVLMAKEDLEPVLVTFKPALKDKLSWVILSNSITLTPGTITVTMENGVFVVHALDKELAAGLDSSIFVKELLKLEAMEK